MIELSKRMSLIAKIVEERPLLGKTAMMKFIFILQQAYKVPLGYDYEIYTYGPYSSTVMEDIQLASDFATIDMKVVIFPNGHSGYQLNVASETKAAINREQNFLEAYSEYISEVIQLFGNKTAKELELSSTIIYIYSNYSQNKWDNSMDEVSQSVKRIKPHFDINEIKRDYETLYKIGILQKSA